MSVKARIVSEPRILAGRDLSLRFLRQDVTLRAEGRAELQEVNGWGREGGEVGRLGLTRDDADWVWVGKPLSATETAKGTSV